MLLPVGGKCVSDVTPLFFLLRMCGFKNILLVRQEYTIWSNNALISRVNHVWFIWYKAEETYTHSQMFAHTRNTHSYTQRGSLLGNPPLGGIHVFIRHVEANRFIYSIYYLSQDYHCCLRAVMYNVYHDLGPHTLAHTLTHACTHSLSHTHTHTSSVVNLAWTRWMIINRPAIIVPKSLCSVSTPRTSASPLWGLLNKIVCRVFMATH